MPNDYTERPKVWGNLDLFPYESANAAVLKYRTGEIITQ